MRRLRRRRACTRGWIGLWLILLNVLAAPLAPSPVMAAVPATLDGQPYIICGMGGAFAPDQQSPSDQNPAHAPDICAFCLPMLHGAAALPVPPPLPAPPAIAVATHAPTPPAQAPPVRVAITANGARAPPV